ncbi:MAG TPA: thiamine-phosphate kinase [Nitrososphaera sp.]|nr:thiamine-phosphate kinase [Nitrososphaera sp.]
MKKNHHRQQLNEKEIIRILSRAQDISDLEDVAEIAVADNRHRRNDLVVFKADMLVASTDVPPQMSPRQVAKKSIVACASDLAAKGARPLAAMIALGLPAELASKAYVKELARGFQAASREFGVKIVGGDTNAAKELVIDCSMVGTIKKNGYSRIPKRSGAKPGDAVIASGRFGYSASGLAVLLKGAKAQGAFGKKAVASVLEPKPRQAFGLALARYFSSSIDSSDGLAASLYEIAIQSGVDIVIDYDAAKAEGVQEFAGLNGLDAHELVFHGGEEYEIVATVPKSLLQKARATARRRKIGCGLHVIGSVKDKKVAGRRVTVTTAEDKRLIENRGYLHFKNS